MRSSANSLSRAMPMASIIALDKSKPRCPECISCNSAFPQGLCELLHTALAQLRVTLMMGSTRG